MSLDRIRGASLTRAAVTEPEEQEPTVTSGWPGPGAADRRLWKSVPVLLSCMLSGAVSP